MMVFIILLLSVILTLISKWMFGKWFNHVSLYSTVWCVTLILFEVRFINYYPMDNATWMIILSSWVFFFIGSATVVAGRSVIENKQFCFEQNTESIRSLDGLKRLKTVLWFLNIITFAAAIHNFFLVSKLFGSLSNAFVMGNLLYSHRVSEGLPGSIPYVGSFVFTAAVLAGNYTAKLEKITLVAILPIIIVIMIDFANMGRADILVVAILFASSYLLTQRQKKANLNKYNMKIRRIAMFILIVAIVVAGAEFIRSTRKAQEGFTGSTKMLKKLSTASVITPSIYLYLSSHHAVFNQYLKHGGEHTPIGGNMFLPLYRIFEKLGLEIHSSTYQEWYRTPAVTNTGTYLRELDGDFGIAGLLFGPYLLGLLSSVFWYRYNEYRRFTDLSVLTFLYGIIGLSFFVIATRMSGFFFFLFVSITVGCYLDKKSNRSINIS